jgi:predicted nucleotidyltransferase
MPPMSTANEIALQLRDKYRPAAVVLHGSRAVGMSRPHSDWDIFLLFTDKPAVAVGREAIAGEDVEWKAVRTPVAENAVLEAVGVELQFGQVLWEDASRAGTRLLEQAAAFFAKGIQLTEADKVRYKQYLLHKVAGMEDDIATPYMFLRHQYAFFLRACNWWFEVHGQYPKPFYLAMPAIQERDAEYHDLLLQVSEPGSNEKRIAAARRLVSMLFP